MYSLTLLRFLVSSFSRLLGRGLAFSNQAFSGDLGPWVVGRFRVFSFPRLLGRGLVFSGPGSFSRFFCFLGPWVVVSFSLFRLVFSCSCFLGPWFVVSFSRALIPFIVYMLSGYPKMSKTAPRGLTLP